MIKSLDDIRQASARFADERDWQQYQSPKNLTMALSVEVAELVELFQWLSEEESRRPDEKTRDAAADEIADILLYLVRVADELEIDIPAAVSQKVVKNTLKYPVDKVSGSDDNYTKYELLTEK